MARKLLEFKHYIGDVNLEYGGLFIDPSDFRHGYADCLRVTDLDSGAGITDTVEVERITVLFDDKDKVKKALSYCGTDFADLKEIKLPYRKDLIIRACASYGYYDLVSDMMGDHRWIVYTGDIENLEDIDLDSWHGEKVILPDGDIFTWLSEQGMLEQYS